MTQTQAAALNKESRWAAVSPTLCGLVLAGGEGQRLHQFVARLRGDALPKQYVSFTGTCSMLEHTYRRAERMISRSRLFTVVNEAHLRFTEVRTQLRDRDPGTVVVQPVNRETGPGLLLPLVHLYRRYPNATVAVFPSDQFILEADRLMRHIRLAHAVIEKNPSALVLLGIAPDHEESDYGYILPSTTRDVTGWGIQTVRAFVEKPDVLGARDLIRKGALWNTMLMVFNAGTLLNWVEAIDPEVFQHFARIYDAIGTAAEDNVVRAAYAQLRTVNFSKELLEPIVEKNLGRLSVLPVTQVTWSDWGTEDRIVSSLSSIGKIPCGTRAAAVAARSRTIHSKRSRPDRPTALTTLQ